jgi:hypothetical protein
MKKTPHDALLEIFRRAYREAYPPADFEALMASGTTQKEGWFNDYYLPLERLTQIFDEVCKEYKIRKVDRLRMTFEVYLGGTPNSIKYENKTR